MSEPIPIYVSMTDHYLKDGDIVAITSGRTRWQRIKRLLVRPRLQVVGEATSTTFVLVERRMTWREWRQAWKVVLF